MDNNEKNIELIVRKLNNELSVSELHDFDLWVKQSKANKKLYSEYKDLWTNTLLSDSELINIDVDKEWKTLSDTLFTNEKAIESSDKLKVLKKRIYSIAAVVVLLICSGIFYLFINNNRIIEEIAVNKPHTIKMKDGSVVDLKTNSKLSYHKNFNNTSRKVRLSGEAYFSVESDKTRPFLIETDQLIVSVTGTSFLVREKKKATTVIVDEGTVEIVLKSDRKNIKKIKAGEKVVFYQSNNEMVKQKNKELNYKSWKTKKFSFDNMKLEHVTKLLEDVYPVKFIYKNQEIKTCRITVSFDKQTIESIARVIEATLDIEIIKLDDRRYQITGKSCN